MEAPKTEAEPRKPILLQPTQEQMKAVYGKIDPIAVAASVCACGCSCGIEEEVED